MPPIATPFRDGSLDLPSLARLIDYLPGHVSGYLVGESVGEVASLTIEERAIVTRGTTMPTRRRESHPQSSRTL